MTESSPQHRVSASFDDIALHYTVYGAGDPTLFFIHGWSCDQAFWRCQTGAFSTSFRVVTLDLAGHGRSLARAAQRAWSIESFGRDVEAIVDAVGARSVGLVGHSMGGAVAVETALRLGDRCRLLLGVDTFTDAAFYGRRSTPEIAGRRRMFEPDFAGTIAEMVDRITPARIAREIPGWIALRMGQTDVTVGLAAFTALLAWDIEARWPSVRAPVETINSALLARDSEQLALERLRVYEIEGVGHFPMLERPDLFNAMALAIVKRHLPA